MDESILSPRDFDSHPAYVYPPYRSSVKRGPTLPLVPLKEKLRNLHAPVYGAEDLGALDHDLTRNAARNGEPLGERIIVRYAIRSWKSGRPTQRDATFTSRISTMRRSTRTSWVRGAA